MIGVLCADRALLACDGNRAVFLFSEEDTVCVIFLEFWPLGYKVHEKKCYKKIPTAEVEGVITALRAVAECLGPDEEKTAEIIIETVVDLERKWREEGERA